MRVALDLTALVPRGVGVDRYLLGLARHLGPAAPDIRFTVFANLADRSRLRELGANVTVHGVALRPRPARLVFQQGLLPLLGMGARFDVIHSPSFLMPLWRGRSRHVLSVHDLTFFSMPLRHNALRRSRAFRAAVAAGIRRADLLCVPSHATRDDLARRFPEAAERVRVVPYGVDARFFVRDGNAEPPGPPYILFVGTIEPRKSVTTLIEAYRLLRDADAAAPDLVLAGRFGWNAGEVRRQLEAPDLAPSVRVLGYVRDDELPRLYRGAVLFVYPSWGEGFGFPPLEAMAAGVPVIAGRNSALEENLAGAAELVPAGDAAALAATLRRLLDDERRREALTRMGTERAAAFRWEETARRTVACYRELVRRETESP